MSRNPIPYQKRDYAGLPVLKKVNIIAMRRGFVYRYAALPPTPLELVESIGFLRLLENGIRLKMVLSESYSISVDTKRRISERVKKTYWKRVIGVPTLFYILPGYGTGKTEKKVYSSIYFSIFITLITNLWEKGVNSGFKVTGGKKFPNFGKFKRGFLKGGPAQNSGVGKMVPPGEGKNTFHNIGARLG